MTNKKIILLVEDEPQLIEMYKVAFREAKVDFLVAENKEAAWEMVRKQKPDLILLDIIIPEQKEGIVNYMERIGFIFLEELKKEPAFKGVKVVALTNLDSTEDREIAKQLGAEEFMVKAEMTPRQVVEATLKYLG